MGLFNFGNGLLMGVDFGAKKNDIVISFLIGPYLNRGRRLRLS
jgi:hypothetical protein